MGEKKNFLEMISGLGSAIKRAPLRIKIFLGLIVVCLVSVGTIGYVAYHSLDKINYDTESSKYKEKTGQTKKEKNNETQTEEKDDSAEIVGKEEEGIHNYFLAAQDSALDTVTNTDSMMILSIDEKNNTVKLISLMRDIDVEIPGYSNAKLNSVMFKGGIDLMYDVIALNFGIEMEGYFLVNFDSFEEIVDELGGVEITLTQKEADYLNVNNYISDPENRNVVAGTQTMNGNQVVGYCRVRHVGNNDFERTQRQRNVLSAIYAKFKDQNPTKLIGLANTVLPYLKTDLTKDEIISLATDVLTKGLGKTIGQLRIPVNNSYTDGWLTGGSSLYLDFDKNKEIMNGFIFEGKFYDENGEEITEKEAEKKNKKAAHQSKGSDDE